MNSNNVLLQKYLKYKSKYLQAGGDDWFCNCINGHNVKKNNAFYKLIFEDPNADDDTQKNSLIEKLEMETDAAKNAIAELILSTETLKNELVFDAHPNLKALTKAYHNFENLLNVKLPFENDIKIKMDSTISFPLFGTSTELTNTNGAPPGNGGEIMFNADGAADGGPNYPLFMTTNNTANTGVNIELDPNDRDNYFEYFKELAALIPHDDDKYILKLDQIIVNMMWWHFLKHFQFRNTTAVLNNGVTINKFFILFINSIEGYLQTTIIDSAAAAPPNNLKTLFGNAIFQNAVGLQNFDGTKIQEILQSFMLVNAHDNVSDDVSNNDRVKNLFSKAFLNDNGGGVNSTIGNFYPAAGGGPVPVVLPANIGDMNNFVEFIKDNINN